MSNVSSHTDEWVPAPLDIPLHWEQIDFEDAFESISLSRLKIPQKDYLSSGIIPVVDQGVNLIRGFTNDTSKSILPARALIVFGDHTKCFKLVGFRFAPGADGIKVLRPIIIDERFAYYACKALHLPDRGYSRHYAFLKRSKIPLAPQNEQLRIVAKIEELFSELDKGIESLKTARRKLEVYRQSALKHAFEGTLTSQWRSENKDKLETPEQLLARVKKERAARYERQLKEWKTAIKKWEKNGKSGKKPLKTPKPKVVSRLFLDETESLPTLAEGWSYLRLGRVIDEPKYGTAKKCDYNYEGTGVLRIPNVISGVIDASDLKGAHFDENEKQVYALKTGDVLLVRSNGSIAIVGKCAVVSKTDEQYLFAGYLIRLRSNPEVLLPDYLATLLSSHLLRTQIEYKAKSTSGVNNINSSEIQSLIVPLCSRSEQEVVVERLSNSLSVTNAAVAEIDAHLLKAEVLRQSILKKAFSGQLVAHDPHDEPAAMLLKRIRAEREKVAKNNRARKTKKRKTTA